MTRLTVLVTLGAVALCGCTPAPPPPPDPVTAAVTDFVHAASAGDAARALSHCQKPPAPEFATDAVLGAAARHGATPTVISARPSAIRTGEVQVKVQRQGGTEWFDLRGGTTIDCQMGVTLPAGLAVEGAPTPMTGERKVLMMPAIYVFRPANPLVELRGFLGAREMSGGAVIRVTGNSDRSPAYPEIALHRREAIEQAITAACGKGCGERPSNISGSVASEGVGVEGMELVAASDEAIRVKAKVRVRSIITSRIVWAAYTTQDMEFEVRLTGDQVVATKL